MSRSIKFRMWDEASGKYADAKNTIECLAQQMRYDAGKKPADGVYYNHIKHGVVFEQYTGLKDENCVEIYDGDIMTHPDFKPSAKLVVSFKDGCFYLGGWDCVRTDFSLGVVVGNKCENPELIEDEE